MIEWVLNFEWGQLGLKTSLIFLEKIFIFFVKLTPNKKVRILFPRLETNYKGLSSCKIVEGHCFNLKDCLWKLFKKMTNS